MEQIVVRGGQRDLIAYALFRLGFHPSESIVLVGLRGDTRRTGVVARFDLPSRGQVARAVERVAAVLRRAGDTEAVVLIFSDASPDDVDPAAVLAHPEVAAAVKRRLQRCRIGVFDVLGVTRRAFRSYLCGDLGCCPPQGTPMAEVMGSVTAAHMVVAGRALSDGESGVIADVTEEPAESPLRRGVQESLATVEAFPEAMSPGLRGRGSVLERWRGFLRPEGGAQTAGVDDIAAFVVALEDPIVRDGLLLTLVPGAGSMPDEVAAGCPCEPGSARDAALGRLLDTTPDEDLLRRGIALLALIARSAPPGRRCEALAMLAWAAWWSEGGVRPRLLARLALDDRPGHRLATLVLATLDAGIEPPWARVGS